MRRALAPLAVIAVLGLAGCQDPYAHDRTEPPAAQATTVTERSGPSSTPTPGRGASSLPSASAMARAFGSRWINWDWQTAASQQRALATLATVDLARQLRANADSARIDATLARDRPGSRGRVVAIELTASGERDAGIVVTREQTLTDGRADLGGARYRVYTVQLEHARGRWEVSAWTPQP